MKYSRVNVALNVEFYIVEEEQGGQLPLEEQVRRNINGWKLSGADIKIGEIEPIDFVPPTHVNKLYQKEKKA